MNGINKDEIVLIMTALSNKLKSDQYNVSRFSADTSEGNQTIRYYNGSGDSIKIYLYSFSIKLTFKGTDGWIDMWDYSKLRVAKNLFKEIHQSVRNHYAEESRTHRLKEIHQMFPELITEELEKQVFK